MQCSAGRATRPLPARPARGALRAQESHGHSRQGARGAGRRAACVQCRPVVVAMGQVNCAATRTKPWNMSDFDLPKSSEVLKPDIHMPLCGREGSSGASIFSYTWSPGPAGGL